MAEELKFALSVPSAQTATSYCRRKWTVPTGQAMVSWTRDFDVGQNDIGLLAVGDGSLNTLNTLAKKARVARKNH